MIRHTAVLAIAACFVTTGVATAQTNTVTNGSFEIADPDFSFLPLGWNDIPAIEPIWADGIARTGTRSMGLPVPSSGTFIGISTNLFDINGDLYDPPYEFQGGDLHVSGYYMIPVGEELGAGPAPDDIVGIKLEFRRVPPNFSIYQAFEYHIPDAATNGEWVLFDIVIPPETISDEFPPYPGSVTILPFRFIPFEVVGQGTIYWDDIFVWQENDCPPDLNGDGIVDNGDIGAFVAAFLAGDLIADFNGDNLLDNGDIGAFVAAFLAGC